MFRDKFAKEAKERQLSTLKQGAKSPVSAARHTRGEHTRASKQVGKQFGISARSVGQETIRAVVEAFAEGKIVLPKVPTKTNKNHIRYAPSFRKASSAQLAEHP